MNNRSLKIAVADDEADVREYFQRVLPVAGHQVVAACRTGRELVEQCRATAPDLVFTDIRMPEMDGLEAAAAIVKERPVPVILVSAYHDAELVTRAEADHIHGYLVKPIKQADLGPAIAVALRRFEQAAALTREAAQLRQSLADRKLIERAKGVVMKRVGLDEAEVYRRLQRLASNGNRKLVDVAQDVLTAEETFVALERT